MNYNFFLVFFLLLAATSSIGQKEVNKDTIIPETGKKIIVVSKNTLMEKLDSIRSVRKDTIQKYQIKGDNIDKIIGEQIKDLSKKSQKKNKVIINKNPIIVEKEIIQKDTVIIKKQSWFKKQINKLKKQK